MSRNDMRGLSNQKDKNVDGALENQEKPTLMQRLELLRDKLKLGPHHKMERFTVMIGATLAFLLLFTASSFVSHRGDVADNVSAQAVYTDDFSFSLSGETMSVHGIYGNEDKTDVMILLSMGTSENMSTDANNYELFITGERKELTYEPEVSFSIFGSTGYAVIRFEHDSPIPKEIVDITIRANAALSDESGSGTSDDPESTDGSFSEFDQGRLYANPGADAVEVLNWLDKGEDDPTTLYTALVAETEDAVIQEEIEKETKELGRLLNRANEYTNRLTSAGYVPPETPWFIKGDYINDDGVFVSAQDVSGAYALDYHTKTIRDGYINQVMNDVSEYSAFMQNRSEGKAEDDVDLTEQEQVESIEVLVHEDGSKVEMNTITTGVSPSAEVSAKGTIETLESTWAEYVRHKANLQRTLMHRLLVLDADVQSQRTFYSEHSGDVASFY